MYVCVCMGVNERQIHEAVKAGALTMKDLRRDLGITQECGLCAPCARACLKAARSEILDANENHPSTEVTIRPGA